MSFKLFDQGFTAEQINKVRKPAENEMMMDRLREWEESEHILNVLRSIKASPEIISKMEVEAWLNITRRRR